MRTILGIFAAFYTVVASGQLEISIIDFASKYDTVRYTNAQDFTFNFFQTGPDFSWDYSGLIGTSQTLLDHKSPDDADQLTVSFFGSSVIPTYRASYYLPATDLPFDFLGDFLQVNIENLYRFYRRTNTSLNIVGLSLVIEGFGLSGRSDTIEVAYQLPMTFGDTWQSVGYTQLDFSLALPAQFAQYRKRSSEVDGYGTLTTPYGTFEAIRVHHIINEIDSLLIDLGGGVTPVAIPLTTHEYEWWTNEQKGPLLKVVANEIAGNEVVTSVQFRDSYQPDLVAGLQNNGIVSFSVFPNPVAEFCSVSAPESGMVYVLDLSGKIVCEQPVSAGKSLVNTTEWSSGAYVVLFHSSQGTQAIQRIIKE
jgi:hypothetical protein